MRIKERVLALLLSMVMVLTFMPALTFAEDALTEAPGETAASDAQMAAHGFPVGLSVTLAPEDEGETEPRELKGYVGSNDVLGMFPYYGDKITVVWSDGYVENCTCSFDEEVGSFCWFNDKTGEMLEDDYESGSGMSFGFSYGENDAFEDEGNGYGTLYFSYGGSYDNENERAVCNIPVKLVEDPVKSVTYHQIRPLVVYDGEITEDEWGDTYLDWGNDRHFIQKGDYLEAEIQNDEGTVETVRYNAELVSVNDGFCYYLIHYDGDNEEVFDLDIAEVDKANHKIILYENGGSGKVRIAIDYVDGGAFPYKSLEFVPKGGSITLLADDLSNSYEGGDRLWMMLRSGRDSFPHFFVEGDAIKLTDEKNNVSTYEYDYKNSVFVNKADGTVLNRDDMINIYPVDMAGEVGNNDVWISLFDLNSPHFNVQIIDECEHEEATFVAAVAPTCGEPGVKEHYVCDNCGRAIAYDGEDGIYELEEDDLIVPATGNHSPEAVAGRPATCKEEGIEDCFQCSVCGKLFSDEACENEIEAPAAIPKAKHTLFGHEAHAASCTTAGNVVYWECLVCDKFFSDSEGKNEIEENSWEVKPRKHDFGAAGYTWSDDNTQVTASHTCEASWHNDSVDGQKTVTETVGASGEVIKPATVNEEGTMKYTSEAFSNEGFEVQTKTVPIEKLTLDEALAQAEEQAASAATDAGNADAASASSTNEEDVSGAESSAQNAANLAAMAEGAALEAQAAAQTAYDEASDDQKAEAKAKLDAATKKVATAKKVKAAANSALATAKKAAAKVASNKAAAASAAAQSAATSAQAEQYRQEAAAQAAKASEKATAAENASTAANEAAQDLAQMAENADESIKSEIEAAKNEANTSAESASGAAGEAGNSSESAGQSAESAQAAVNDKANAEQAAAAAAAQPAEIVDLPAVKIAKPKAAKKKVTVKWKKVNKKNLKKIQGIEIRVSGPGVDKVVTAGKKKTSKKVGGLQSKQKYTVQVRAYAMIGGVKHVSAWKSKTVKVK